jgi:hypothetical protein
MIQFLLGLLLGAAGAIAYKSGATERLRSEPRMNELQDRANAVLRESRMILEEARGELRSALEAGRSSVQEKATRIKQAAQEPNETEMQNEQGGTGPFEPTAMPSGIEPTDQLHDQSLNEPLTATENNEGQSNPGSQTFH